MRSKLINQYQTCIPGYNWCGPFCSGPEKPVNKVDSCCKQHDLCYKRRGYSSCRCDKALLQCLRPLINLYTQEGITAAMIYKFFSNFPSNKG